MNLGRELLVPAASTAAAAAVLGFALLTTLPGARVDPGALTPERAAEAFAAAYHARDFAAAARLAAGHLRRSLEQKARSARLQDGGGRGELGQLMIEESVLLARNRLRFTGALVSEGEPEESGRTVSITIARHGDTYLAEAIQWPKGAPPEER